MFEDLLNFSKRRTNKQAVGFYLTYTAGLFVLLAVVRMLVTIFGSDAVQIQTNSLIIGWTVIPLYCVGLSALVVQKRSLRSFGSIMLVFLAGGLGLVLGFLGTAVAAYLTTRESDNTF